jgi:hypothetical protein
VQRRAGAYAGGKGMDFLTDFLTAWKIPVGQWGKSFFSFLTDNFEFVFDAIADSLKYLLDAMIDGLLWFPPLIVVWRDCSDWLAYPEILETGARHRARDWSSLSIRTSGRRPSKPWCW